MGAIFVVSVAAAAGKTTVCAGLGKYLTSEGKKVGVLKPPCPGCRDGDSDAAFLRQSLGLAEVVDAADVIQGSDVVLVECTLGPDAKDSVSQETYRAAAEMKAKVIAVEAYTEKPSKYADSYKGFGESLLGVVVNKVPASRLKTAAKKAAREYGAAGVSVLGLIPESRALLALTVGELAASVNGKIRNNAEKAAELVENYMLGAMVVDSGLDYFGRKSNKAAVIRQDRPDMQLAALETSTRCLVLTGSAEAPVYNVLQKAEVRGIPVISSESTTADTVAAIEEALGRARLEQEKKLPVLTELVRSNLDLKVLA